MQRSISAALLAAAILAPGQAAAWGGTGHRIIGQAAIESLPAQLPAFLRTPAAALDIGERSRELDRAKGAGKVHDQNRDPGHFLDLSDDGTVLGGPKLANLPTTREDYESALRAAGTDSWKAGWLPYSILEDVQQLAKDFAYWRVDRAGEAHETSKTRRAWLTADRLRRETQIRATLGELSHYVGDGSQPLHMTLHYNGWGDFPDPKGYTHARIHGPFESDFVAANVNEAAVRKAMPPPAAAEGALEQRIVAYLASTAAEVEPLYDLEKSGAFLNGDRRGVAFATTRIAIGAAELRDLIVEAWEVSPKVTVGWPAVSLADVESGKADAYLALFGKD